MKIGLWIVAASMLLVVVEGFASYYISKNFFPSQVIARWGQPGIAFITHGGMWGDLFLLPALMAWIITRYGNQWSTKQIVIMGFVGFAITLGNHLLLIFTQKIPDPLGWQKEWWSVPIALHFVYMTTYVALAGLFFFHSHPSVGATVLVATLLGIHMLFGTHIPLGILNLRYHWEWCPTSFLHTGALWMQAGIWMTLSALAYIAAGPTAGLLMVSISEGVCGLGFCGFALIIIRELTL